jgi:hypothetical protein
VDGNQVTATARGNLTTNSLDFSALSVDMTAAELGTPSTPAGTNLASIGAVQVIDGNSSVAAQINAAAPGNAEILGKIAGRGDRTNIALSVDNNSVIAAATGTTAVSSLNGSGGILAQDAPGVLAGTLTIGALPTTGIAIADTAAANAIVQSNAGSVSARLATTNVYDIDADIEANDTANVPYRITDSVITADNNRTVALAIGSSADASTALAFEKLESSAATAVQQAQNGSTTATVGGSGGGINILASTQQITPLATAKLINTSLSASGNVAGAQATGATAATSLAAGDANTVTLASGYSANAPNGANASITAAGVLSSSATDYMLGVQQNISGATTASADNMSVLASGGLFAGGSLTADNNFLTAQATGGISQGPLDANGVPTPATLSLTANDMTAGGVPTNTVNAALASDQRLSGPVSAALTASDVTASAINLTNAANGTNSSETISASNNTLLAEGLGLGSSNALTTAASSVAGDSSGVRTADVSGDVTGSGWDRLIVSNQNIDATGAVLVSAAVNSVTAAVTGSAAPAVPGDINVDTLKVENNTLLAQGTGGSSSNTLSTTAGDAINALSQAILARQSTAGAVLSSNTTVAANLNVAGNSTDSAASISGNQLAATATGLSGSNSLSMNSGTSITDSIGLSTLTTLILSDQEMLPSSVVTATLINSQASLGVTASLGGGSAGNVDGSTLKVDNNSLLAQATGATSSNNLSTTAGAGISSVSQAIASLQDSAAPVLANSTVTSATLNVAGNSTTSSLSVSGNELAAAATGLSSANTLAQKSNVSIVDDGLAGPLVPSGILSEQILADTASVQAGLTASQTALGVTGDVTGSTLKVDDNKLLAQATGATSSNNFSASAGTTIDSVFQGIIALQESDAPVSAINARTTATLNVGGAGTNSSLSVSGNELAATATGLNGSNSASMSSDVSIIDTRVLPPNGIVSIQGLSDTGLVTATLSGAIATLSVTDDVNGSSLKVDNNLQQASAKGSNNINTLSVESGSFGTTVPDGIGLTIYASQDSEAPVIATNIGAGNFLTIGGAASGDSLVLSGNSIGASASNLTGENSMTVKAVTANIGDTSTLSYLTGPTASADRSILSTQNVANTGDVSATVTDPTMSLSVAGGLSGNSTAYLSSNTIASAATIAANTNTLTNSAKTLLTSSALIGSVQNSAADSTALTDLTSGGLFINIGTGTSDATVALADNQVTASATGLTATNTLNVTAGSMQGAIPPVLGSITASAPLGVINHNMNSALSAISSEQTTSGAISAEVLSPYLGIDLDVGVTNSAVHADSNLVQASSTAASATNTLMQLADTSMSDTPALIAASQVISGSSAATVTDAWIWSHIDGNVNASNMTANNNTIQAVATGGAMKNYLDPGAGTSITAQINEPDPSVTTASSSFTGSYGLVSRQVSTAAVTATVDAEPWVELAVSGNIDNNSAVSASGNIIRAQAANLTTDNSVVTAAATALSGVTSGVLSYQNVAAATSASVTGTQVQLTGGDLTGAANADSNWLVAIATGGDVTNDLKVTGLSVSGMPAGAVTSLATSNLSLAAT